jgi:phosphotransferase system enzyme I (PtsI)
MMAIDGGEIRLTGISGSPGICIGKAYLVDRQGVNVVEKYYLQTEQLSDEINRFKTAVKTAKDEIGAVIDATPEDLREHVDILETHMALYKDKMLYTRTIDTIKKEMVNAEWALKKVVAEVKVMFQSISDPYLRGRATDIEHVAVRILRNLVGVDSTDIGRIDKRVILVAEDLSPADTAQIQLDRVKGFITDRGGKASHTGIIARTMGIPCVLGMDDASRRIKSDDIVVLDGGAGLVILHPSDQTIIHYEERQEQYEAYRAVISEESGHPAETIDGFRLLVMGNIEVPEEVPAVIRYGGEGVGLFRTEFLYLKRDTFPSEEELFQQYQRVVSSMAMGPVVIRTLDINGDKALSHTSDANEANPALGLRAIRFCLKRPDVFMSQLRAILRAAVYGNVHIMFPMISTFEEVRDAKRMLDEAAASLSREGIPHNRDLKVGIMVEVPSAVIMADVLADEVDFFSIGTNDLIQYSLAIDRGNKDVAHLYHPLNPAVLRMVKRVVDVGREKGVRVFMCGEMAGDPFNLPILIGMGLDAISMTPQSIPAAKSMIKRLRVDDATSFVTEVLKKSRMDDIVNMTREAYGSVIPEGAFVPVVRQ